MQEEIIKIINDSIEVKKGIVNNIEILRSIETAISAIVSCYECGGKVVLMGNGGSAGDAQHICAELVGRFVLERPSLSAIALNTDSSVVTAIANDYGYDNVFSRQVEGIVKSCDVVIGISTSGNSVNITKALKKARDIGAITIGLLGKAGGECKNFADINIIINTQQTARIQESHIMIGHIICDQVEKLLFSGQI